MSVAESSLENLLTLISGLICGLSTNSFTIVNRQVCVVVWRTLEYVSLVENTVVSQLHTYRPKIWVVYKTIVCPALLIGLDDARNTAKLCYRMVKDGCRLNITKSLWKKVSSVCRLLNVSVFRLLHVVVCRLLHVSVCRLLNVSVFRLLHVIVCRLLHVSVCRLLYTCRPSYIYFHH